MRSVALILVIALAAPCEAGEVAVEVVVDMDADTPGIQSSVTVSPCTETVSNIAIYIRDPLESRTVWSIGYLGGIDRGIAFGHVPDANNLGTVTHVEGAAVMTIHPENTGYAYGEPALQSGFEGPEVQYVEAGKGKAPAVIPAIPSAPVFTVDVMLSNVAAGDTFAFHLLDVVSIWAGPGYGAFSTQKPINSLDTGGDAVPDQTMTKFGTDPDAPVPVPPASYAVDYIDGPANGGPATIVIRPVTGDATGDCAVNVDDLLAVINAWGACQAPCPPNCPADVNNSCSVNVDDLLIVINNWG